MLQISVQIVIAMLIGVLALQGDVAEHAAMLRKILKESEVVLVKKSREIAALDGLVIPGGESTTIGKLMQKYEIDKAIAAHRSLALFGTCAGAIMLAKEVTDGLPMQASLKLMDVKIQRNAYGRQKESFETEIEIPALGAKPYRAIFIRAPVIKSVGKDAEVLASYEKSPVLVRQGRLLAATFHPELTGDLRVHEYFAKMVKEK